MYFLRAYFLLPLSSEPRRRRRRRSPYVVHQFSILINANLVPTTLAISSRILL